MIGRFQVLVVDDDPDKSGMLQSAFGLEGYDVHIAKNGREALSAMESFQPDLVVTDVMMPEVNGYELAKQIRKNPRTRFVPIILQSSARAEPEDFRRGAEVGALGFITDPTDFGLLLSQARTLLDFRAYLDTCEDAAFTDHITGLANRRRFERQLEREIARTERYGHPFCLLLVDIDDFKQVNDTYGHDVGDQIIILLSKTLHDGIRSVDLAARIGGDEFAVILTETHMKVGIEIAERLRRTFKAAKVSTVSSETVSTTASIGIVEAPTAAEASSGLLARADIALYRAKREGRDRVRQSLRVSTDSAWAADSQQSH
jgi:diguanylate cyclase (GGDEF)-like protein